MTSDSPDRSHQPAGLRLWPGVVLVALQWFLWAVLPQVWTEPVVALVSPLSSVVGTLLIVVWWVFLSRARKAERWAAVPAAIVALFATSLLLHESIGSGMMRVIFVMYALPVLCLALVGWALWGGGVTGAPRRAAMMAILVVTCGAWTLVRSEGAIGNGSLELAWRWSPTSEEKLLSMPGKEPALQPAAPAETTAEWPGFRGPERDSVIRGVRVATDWSVNPPKKLWSRPVGPGWSSFAVHGDLFYTQEQRGEEEIVACYDVVTGDPVWRHSDPVRFWESIGGAGPRATPTLDEGRVYAFGATGVLSALDAADGSLIWSSNAGEEAEVEVPTWGFSSSPVVADGVVIVAAAGRLAAFDAETGETRWLGDKGGASYSSPHRLTIGGVDQVLHMSKAGATSVVAASGEKLWKHEWDAGSRIVQPAMIGDSDLLMSEGETRGLRRVSLKRNGTGWTAEELWTTNRLKPYFNDFVAHEGHAYGFDGRILTAIDVNDGERKWKGGRYGQGQMLLLADQDLLVVLGEEGELALVRATPEKFEEVARIQAIEGKTWNHPVLVRDVLLVRNGQEMAAFRLAGG